MKDVTTLELGKIAYEAYCDELDGKTWRGEPFVDFDDLPDNIKAAWAASTVAVADAL